MKARIDDSVLVRFKVVPTTQGSTWNLYPGIAVDGKPIKLDKLDIVSVEQEFRVGDRVRLLRCESNYNVGEISALSPAGHEPLQAWIKIDGQFPLATRDVRSLERLDS